MAADGSPRGGAPGEGEAGHDDARRGASHPSAPSPAGDLAGSMVTSGEGAVDRRPKEEERERQTRAHACFGWKDSM